MTPHEILRGHDLGDALDGLWARAASGMEARSVETAGLDPKDDSPTRKGDAQTQSESPHDK